MENEKKSVEMKNEKRQRSDRIGTKTMNSTKEQKRNEKANIYPKDLYL